VPVADRRRYLTAFTKAALQEATLAPEVIDWLDTMYGMSQALNNSKNPFKAACTMLAKETNVEIFAAYLERERTPVPKSYPPEVVDFPAIAEEALQKHRRAVAESEEAEVKSIDVEGLDD
jgi:hypothetical protein